MTVWQSMFDASPTGKCNIVVKYGVIATMWAGNLGKGESSPDFVSLSKTYTVAVSADGVVSLNSSNRGNPGLMKIEVYPASDTATLLRQVKDVSIFAADGTSPVMVDGTALDENTPEGDVALSGSTLPATPSFAVFQPTGAPVGEAFVAVSCGGIS